MSDDEMTSSQIFISNQADEEQKKSSENEVKVKDHRDINRLTLDVSHFLPRQGNEKRAHKRFAYFGEVFITDTETQKIKTAKTADISEGGLALSVSNDFFRVGQKLIVELKGSMSMKPLQLVAEVVRLDRSVDATKTLDLGLKVVSMSKLAQKRIHEFIETYNDGY